MGSQLRNRIAMARVKVLAYVVNASVFFHKIALLSLTYTLGKQNALTPRQHYADRAFIHFMPQAASRSLAHSLQLAF